MYNQGNRCMKRQFIFVLKTQQFSFFLCFTFLTFRKKWEFSIFNDFMSCHAFQHYECFFLQEKWCWKWPNYNVKMEETGAFVCSSNLFIFWPKHRSIYFNCKLMFQFCFNRHLYWLNALYLCSFLFRLRFLLLHEYWASSTKVCGKKQRK